MSNTPIHTTNLTENAHQGIYDLGAHEPHRADAHGPGTFKTKHSQPVLPASSSPLLTPKQAAAHLGVCVSTLYRLVERRELAVVRVARTLRISPDDLHQFIERGRTGPT